MENKDNTKERVAFDLAVKIMIAEKDNVSAAEFRGEAREYWFNLYYQSLRIINGNTPEEISSKEN